MLIMHLYQNLLIGLLFLNNKFYLRRHTSHLLIPLISKSTLLSTDSDAEICQLCLTSSSVCWGYLKDSGEKEIRRSASCCSYTQFPTRENQFRPPVAIGIPRNILITLLHTYQQQPCDVLTPQMFELQCLNTHLPRSWVLVSPTHYLLFPQTTEYRLLSAVIILCYISTSSFSFSFSNMYVNNNLY